ncbi:MAG: 1,4-dihydroxy-2-naphthoate polyprenyltransferase [Coriobacteriia bacterium]|jgi:1,4-dihydroxy-2-naphthoate octaprenyltransferase|nr:1,4-dihydroxy-2-naphthoate polyprenyltransferase [Coriobacteriia bacterium]
MSEHDTEPPQQVPSAHRPGPLGVWALAIRPKTLPAAAASVIIGTALAWYDGVFAPGPALAALLIALLLQIGSNLANDVYDDERGADTTERLGPVRVTQSGLLSRAQVKRGMAVVFGAAFVLGLYLTWVRGPMVLVVGIAAIIAAIAYTGGPWPLGYHGLGEVFVFLFFGVTAVVGTYWVQGGTPPLSAWLMSIPAGLLIVAILVVNNLRDIEQDRAAHKHTIAVRIGPAATRMEYAMCVAGAYLVVALGVAFDVVPVHAMASWLSIPLAYATWRVVASREGRPLNRALALTGQTTLLFAIFFAVGMVVAGA